MHIMKHAGLLSVATILGTTGGSPDDLDGWIGKYNRKPRKNIALMDCRVILGVQDTVSAFVKSYIWASIPSRHTNQLNDPSDVGDTMEERGEQKEGECDRRIRKCVSTKLFKEKELSAYKVSSGATHGYSILNILFT